MRKLKEDDHLVSRLNVCFMFHISVPIFHYSCHITEAEGEVGIP